MEGLDPPSQWGVRECVCLTLRLPTLGVLLSLLQHSLILTSGPQMSSLPPFSLPFREPPHLHRDPADTPTLTSVTFHALLYLSYELLTFQLCHSTCTWSWHSGLPSISTAISPSPPLDAIHSSSVSPSSVAAACGTLWSPDPESSQTSAFSYIWAAVHTPTCKDHTFFFKKLWLSPLFFFLYWF